VPVVASTALGQQAPSPPAATAAPGTPAAPPARGGSPFGRGMREFKAPPVTTVVPDAIATPDLGFFSDSQMAALRRLGDLLMPPLNGYPGALQAEAPEFLDFLVSASPDDRQLLYRQGLDRLNAEAKKQFGKAFADLDAEQADKIVRPALLAWMTDHPPAEPFPHFIAIAHENIRTATMNSKAWSVAAASLGERAPGERMFWCPIDPDPKNWA
jgi:Gluconate 2-dehydrogenase subunit 3